MRKISKAPKLTLGAPALAQIWINPLQGWNQMQRAVDLAAKDSAFVKSPLWPVTAFLLAKDAVIDAGRRSHDWLGVKREKDAPVRDAAWVNEQLVSVALKLNEAQGWEPVISAEGIEVWRKYLPPDLTVSRPPQPETALVSLPPRGPLPQTSQAHLSGQWR